MELSCRSFPNLTSLDLQIDCALVDRLDRLAVLQWPDKLHVISIEYNGEYGGIAAEACTLLSGLLGGLPTGVRELHLTSSSLIPFPIPTMRPLLTRFDRLEHLTLFMPHKSMCVEMFEMITEIGSHLQSLEFGDSWAATLTVNTLRTIRLPELRSGGDLFRCFGDGSAWNDATFLETLAEAMPRLEELSLSWHMHPQNFRALSRCTALQRLKLFTPHHDEDISRLMSSAEVATALSQCSLLTDLRLRRSRLEFSSDQWSRCLSKMVTSSS
jgi:hypothetical protein